MRSSFFGLAAFTVLLTLAVPASDLVRSGKEAFRRSNWTAAEIAFRAAIKANPRDAEAWKWLGMTYAARNDMQRAEEPFRTACRLDPRDESACYYQGRADYELSRFEDARGSFEQALRAKPDSMRAQSGLGLALEALGQFAKAEALLQRAAQSGSSDALSAYGLFLMRQGRASESLRVLERSGDKAAVERVRKSMEAAPSGKPETPYAGVEFAAAPLPMTVRNGAQGEMHQVETMIAGVAVIDFDGDGWPDIYVCNGATVPALVKADASYSNRLFRNRGDGTFEDVTAKAGVAGRGYSMGAAVADYDNDGHPDLFVTGVRENILYHNKGDGTFEHVTSAAGLAQSGGWSVAAGWFDYDNDGRLDLFVVRYVKWDPAAEPECGDGKPEHRAYCHPKYYAPLPNALYRNRGDGTFEDVSSRSGIGSHPGKGMGVAFADYDGDGFTDVFVANDTTPNFLFHNRGDGAFDEVALEAGVAYNGDGRATSSMGADFRDFDNDGLPDIFMTTISNEGFSLFRNLGRRGFADIAQPAMIGRESLRYSGWSGGIFDFNNDGLKDLFSANGHVNSNMEAISNLESRQSNLTLLNRGSGHFKAVTVGEKALHRGAAFADFNGDGRMDVVVTQLDGPPVLLTNTTTGSGHWLRLLLRGHTSNRDGIGAKVRVTTDRGVQWNHVSTSVGYGGASEAVAHFGLGPERVAKKIEIIWPSGVRQVLEKLAADQLIGVEEPAR